MPVLMFVIKVLCCSILNHIVKHPKMNSHVNVKNEEVNYKVHMTSLGIFFKNSSNNAKYDSELNNEELLSQT